MQQAILLFDRITATATKELDTWRGKDVLLIHEMVGVSTGGYLSFEDQAVSSDNATPQRILSIARTSNTAVVTMAEPHGLAVGHVVKLENVTPAGETTFDGLHTVTAISGNTFSFAQTADDDTATGGTAKRLVKVTHLTAAAGGGTNIKTGNATATYQCLVTNCADVLRVTCNITDGTHTVYAKVMPV